MSRSANIFSKIYHQSTLSQKMIFFYIFLVCVPMFLIGGVYVSRITYMLTQEYERNKEELLEQKKITMESTLSRIRFCTSAFQYNTSLLDYVERYDFSTADGAESWLSFARPAFQQIDSANPDFSVIRIWRIKEKALNDPRYVLNKSDNPELEKIEPMSLNSIKLFVQQADVIRECHFYQVIYNTTRLSKIGYVEVDCDIDVLLAPLQFLHEEEQLFLTLGKEVYRVMLDGENKIYLVSWENGLPENGKRATLHMEEPELRLDYYYSGLDIWSDATFLTISLVVIFMFVLFTVVYYAFYYSITKRIRGLTSHMLHSTTERMQMYQPDSNQDEIGIMVRVYNQIAEKVNALNDEILQKERLTNQAQYYAMQSQIHPHFLYNTLENIDMLIEVGENEKASRMMAVFGKILRYNLSRHREMATLEEEITHVQDYLKLYSYRMRDNFEWSIELEPSCRQVQCPYCMMQPVVENCFKHGFLDPEGQFWVHIRVYEKDGSAWIEIEDNGEGISQDRLRELEEELRMEKKPEKEGTEVGLRNVRERIILMCKEGSDLLLHAGQQGCLVTIKIRI